MMELVYEGGRKETSGFMKGEGKKVMGSDGRGL